MAATERSSTGRERTFWLLILVCAALGLTARLWNVDFDQGQHLHPDERFWAMTADAIGRQPAPAEHGTLIGPVLDWLDGQRTPASAYRGTESFLYGPISLAAARGTASWLSDGVTNGDQPAAAVAETFDAIGVPLINDDGTANFNNRYDVELVGRMLSAIFDTITLVVIGLIGRRFGGRICGIAAAALYASSVLAIQHAHFLGSEPLLGLGSAVTVLFALRLDRGADGRRAAITGAAVGLAAGFTVAAKLTGVGIAVVPFVGCAWLLVRHRRRSDVIRLASAIVAAALAFRVFNPAAFNGLGISLSTSFTDDLRRASELSSDTAPPSFQWAKRIPVLQPLVWLGVFTVGPGIVIAAAFGTIAMSLRLAQRRFGERVQLMTDIGRWPIVIVVSAVVMPFAYIARTSVTTGRYFIPMLPGLYAIAALGVAAALRWARRSHGVDRWTASGIAAVSVGLATIWGVAFVNGVYAQPNTRVEASRWIAANVEPGSVLTSQNWDDGLPLRLPGIDADAYGNVQFDMVGPDDIAKVALIAQQLLTVDYVVESSPRIWASTERMPARFPSTINFFDGLDSGALGFERVATFETGLRLGPWRLDDSTADESFFIVDHPEVRIWAKTRDIGRADIIAVLDPDAASNAIWMDPNDATANGLFLYPDEIATNATGPTYDDAFDTGGSSALHAAWWFVLLELFGLVAFVIALPLFQRLPDAGLGISKTVALGLLSFAVFVAAAWLDLVIDRTLVVVIAVAFGAIGLAAGWRRRDALRGLWRERRRRLIAVEAVTAAMFIAFVVLRAMNPDLWHPDRSGEKPFELTFLTAVLRTKTLPVYDPWFSGGSINYYYGGWFLLTMPARLLRTSPAMTLNLGIALFASCASGAAFSLGAALAATARRINARVTVIAGLLSVVLVLLLGNSAILRSMWTMVSGGELVGTGRAPGQVDWWALSRLIPDGNAITEFPAWSLLFADLHPHVMGMGLFLAIATMCVALHRALVEHRRSAAAMLGLAIGGSAGLLRMTNTWDLPLAAGFVAAAFVAALLSKVSWRRCIIPALTVVAAVVIAWAPYTWRNQVYDAGFDPARFLTRFGDWIQQYGFFVAITLFVIALHVGPAWRGALPVWGRVITAHLVVAGTAFVAVGYSSIRPGRATFVACVLLAIGSAWAAWRTWRGGTPDGRENSVLGPIALAIGWIIPAGVEMLTVRNDLGRQNSVFKFWFESWIVLAIGSAVIIAEQITSHRDRVRGWPRRVAAVLVASAMVLAVGFWSLAAPPRIDDRVSDGGLTLDGDHYLLADPPLIARADDQPFALADDLALVEWLRANVHGIRVVAEAPGEDYRWTGRIAWLTGLATPIGWPYHESQQKRPLGDEVATRHDDLTQLYSTTDRQEMARVLSRYSVEYVVFGTQERILASIASANALRSFECLHIVAATPDTAAAGTEFDRGDLFVATVDRSCVNRLRPALSLPVELPNS